jgi:two-component SAPR family response regulator
MSFTCTRVILPGIGAICVEYRTEDQFALTPVRIAAANNGRLTEPRVSQSENANVTRGIEDPTPAAKFPAIPPDSVSEPGVVIRIVAEYPAQSARWRASDVEGSHACQLTLRVEKRVPVDDLQVSRLAPELVEQPFEEERGAILSPIPSTVPVAMAQPEVARNYQASAAVIRPLERTTDQDTSASLPVAVIDPDLPPIQVICFGSPRVMCAGQQVWPGSGGDVKPWELLLYLACQPAEGIARETVMQALWRDEHVTNDAHRFRQLRYRLRQHLQQVANAPDGDGICFDRHVLRLDPGVVWSDPQHFAALVYSARCNPGGDVIERLERARALYTGDLLLGEEFRRFAWIDERDGSGVTLREHFRRLLQKASKRLADLYAESGELNAAIDLYRELTENDPAHDDLWVALFRLHARRNDRNALIAEDQRLRHMLRVLAKELGALASPEMKEPGEVLVREFHRLLAHLQPPGDLRRCVASDQLRGTALTSASIRRDSTANREDRTFAAGARLGGVA